MSVTTRDCCVAVFGASGLIGRAIVDDLRRRRFTVVGVARRFAPGQMEHGDYELPIVSLSTDALAEHLLAWRIDLVVNCLGVLQDGPGNDTQDVHHDFVARLLDVLHRAGRPIGLAHISIPGDASGDRTAFSRTKRDAEELIKNSGLDYAILRPGFVIARPAYGGSAMLRALAALPLDLPRGLLATSFRPVAVSDIAATVAWLAVHDKPWAGFIWDLMQPQPITLGDVIAEFRRGLSGAAGWRLKLRGWMLRAGAVLGDVCGLLGWASPMRSTALAELQRGVSGDPLPWMTATGIIPTPLADAVGRNGASVQEKWFARLFLLKAIMIISLAAFWIVSGVIAIGISYQAAREILVVHRFPPSVAGPLTIATSLADIAIGVLISLRRTCATGLVAGIVVSIGYLASAALVAPDLWIEPLGALVKTIPSIVLMLATLSILDNR